MNSQTLRARFFPAKSPSSPSSQDRLGLLHSFSDSVLHSLLLAVLLVLATLALAKIIDTMTLTIWQLEPVVVKGQPYVPPARR